MKTTQTRPTRHKKITLHFALKQKKNNELFASRKKENIIEHSNHGKPANADNNPPDRKNQAKEEKHTNNNAQQGKNRNGTMDRNPGKAAYTDQQMITTNKETTTATLPITIGIAYILCSLKPLNQG